MARILVIEDEADIQQVLDYNLREKGHKVFIASTGEEAQLLLRVADVGIGANRRAAMKLLETNHGSNVFVLDDGFQHWPLPRSLDIVLIDAIDPFRNGLPPRGQLREPFSSLARAHIIVLTRTQPESFRRTLSGLGIECEFFREFPDHHHYGSNDLKSMDADVLLTTEKELLNIEPSLRARVVAVPMRLEFDDEEALWQAIAAAIPPTATAGA